MNGRLRIIGALWFFQIANYLDRTVIGFAGPTLMKALSMPPETFGVLLSSFAIGYGLAQIPGGILADRWSARALLIVSPLLWALFTGLTGLLTTVTALVVVRLLLGLSEALSNSAMVKLLGDHFEPHDRAVASGLLSTSFAIAPAIAGPLVGSLIGAFGWRSIFFLMALPALVAAVINYICVPRDGAEVSAAGLVAHDAIPIGQLLRLPVLWLAAAIWFLFFIAFSGFIGWMPSYLSIARGVDVKASGVLGGIPYFAGVIGLLALGWAGRGGRMTLLPRVLAASFAGGAIGMWIAFAAPSLVGCVFGLSVAAFFLFGIIGTFAAIAVGLAPPGSRGAFWGVTSTVGQIGAVLAPYAIGRSVGLTGSFAGSFGLMTLALLMAAAMTLLIPSRPLAPAARA
ncbi:MFS transporter [Sphingomonas oligophenolica]|uniref:MFS transporter n=1 Tax=Sphingomonas oligophenolica TaxID=301154 RepID=A0ABU9Y8S3_9SPHN